MQCCMKVSCRCCWPWCLLPGRRRRALGAWCDHCIIHPLRFRIITVDEEAENHCTEPVCIVKAPHKHSLGYMLLLSFTKTIKVTTRIRWGNIIVPLTIIRGANRVQNQNHDNYGKISLVLHKDYGCKISRSPTNPKSLHTRLMFLLRSKLNVCLCSVRSCSELSMFQCRRHQAEKDLKLW